MAVYQYTASNIGGKIKKGQMTTNNPDQLREALKLQNLYLIEFEEKINKTVGKKLNGRELAEFCRELSALLGSGVSVVRSFSIICKRQAAPKLKAVYTSISTQIKRGVTLSDAMAMQGNTFPEMLINMIKAGEASGKIDQTFEKMSVHYEKEYRLNNNIKSALAYPKMLGILIVLVVMVLFTFIMPTFFELFEGMELPVLTQIVMKISDIFKQHFIMIVLIGVIVCMGVYYLFHIYIVRKTFDRIKIKIPKVGALMKIIYTSQFARTLASLYASGMNIIDSLQISKNTIPNLYIREQFDPAIRKVRSGNTLSETLETIDGFDIKLSQTVEVGEETGRLDTMLISTADSYEYESQKAVSKLISIIQPVMIVFMAGIVLLIVGAVMLPIFSMYGNIEKSSDQSGQMAYVDYIDYEEDVI
ncbi:MAG: type II secretion system F family protein [Oscillospiraceae bacterium]|nr:type II secretion system F family protein [Oscillospiraceae bacterium]